MSRSSRAPTCHPGRHMRAPKASYEGRTPPTGGYAPRPYGSSVRGYQQPASFSPHSDEEARTANEDENAADNDEHDALPMPHAGK